MRELKCLKKYRHFKGREYFVLCKSTAISNKELMKNVMSMLPVECMKCTQTEDGRNIKVYRRFFYVVSFYTCNNIIMGSGRAFL